MTHAQLKANALRWANRQRAKQGKKALKRLPRATRATKCAGYRCPLERAVGGIVGEEHYYPAGRESRQIPLPVGVRGFVEAFDCRDFPELEPRR